MHSFFLIQTKRLGYEQIQRLPIDNNRQMRVWTIFCLSIFCFDSIHNRIAGSFIPTKEQIEFGHLFMFHPFRHHIPLELQGAEEFQKVEKLLASFSGEHQCRRVIGFPKFHDVIVGVAIERGKPAGQVFFGWGKMLSNELNGLFFYITGQNEIGEMANGREVVQHRSKKQRRLRRRLAPDVAARTAVNRGIVLLDFIDSNGPNHGALVFRKENEVIAVDLQLARRHEKILRVIHFVLAKFTVIFSQNGRQLHAEMFFRRLDFRFGITVVHPARQVEIKTVFRKERFCSNSFHRESVK